MRKTNPEARTDLEEVIASGTVVAYAPVGIDAEIRKHVSDYAAKWQVPITTLQTLWDDFRPTLRLCPDRDINVVCSQEEYTRLRLIGPDDLKYAVARETIAADAVLTKDRDFANAGMLMDLRDYARSKAI